MDKNNFHLETIRCPYCGAIFQAEVKHTYPFWTYITECPTCDELIMESEWEEVKSETN